MTDEHAAPDDDAEGLAGEIMREYLKRQAEYAERRTKGPTTTPEQRARYNTRDRLKRLERDLQALAENLQRKHADRSGNARWGYVAGFPREDGWETRTNGSPGIADRMARARADAENGCEQSAKFAERMGGVFEWCAEWRDRDPPERAADYSPWDEWSDAMRERIAQLAVPRVK